VAAWAPLLLLAVLLALGGCLQEAEDKCFTFDNPADTSTSDVCVSGEGTGTGTGTASGLAFASIDTANEIVVIVNQGDLPFDMSEWTLEAQDSGDIFTFPATFTLQAGNFVRIRSGDGIDDFNDLYWTGADHWTSSIDTATLKDSIADGSNVILVCSFTSSKDVDC
jgi:hypothetical protein